MGQNKKTVSIIGLVVVIVLLAFSAYRFFWSSSVEQDVAQQAALQAEADKVNPFNQETTNPFEESTNPYEKIKTNPFE